MKGSGVVLIPAILFLAAGALPAQENALAERLFALETEFLREFRGSVGMSPDVRMEKLRTQYQAALRRAMDSATSAGNLETAVAMRNELKWVEANPGKAPPRGEGAEPPSLAPLRQAYTRELAELTKARQDALAKAIPAFDAKLGVLQNDLTRSNRLEDALAVKNYRESMPKAVQAALLEGAHRRW